MQPKSLWHVQNTTFKKITHNIHINKEPKKKNRKKKKKIKLKNLHKKKKRQPSAINSMTVQDN